MKCPNCENGYCEDGSCENKTYTEKCLVCKVPIDFDKGNYRISENYDSYTCSKCIHKKECDYCGEFVDKVRPSPFMGDLAEMCKHCWNHTKVEYANSHDEHIDDFEDYPHFD